MQYASFVKRWAAWIVDNFIWGIGSYIISMFVGMFAAVFVGASAAATQNAGKQMSETDAVMGLGILLVMVVLYLALYLVYFVWPESSSWQATIGKKIFGLKVVNTENQRISFWRSLGRNLGMIISGIILWIGYLMCIWTGKKQCLHDMMASCLVIDETPEEKKGWAIAVIVLWFLLLLAMIAIWGLFVFAIVSGAASAH